MAKGEQKGVPKTSAFGGVELVEYASDGSRELGKVGHTRFTDLRDEARVLPRGIGVSKNQRDLSPPLRCPAIRSGKQVWGAI